MNVENVELYEQVNTLDEAVVAWHFFRMHIPTHRLPDSSTVSLLFVVLAIWWNSIVPTRPTNPSREEECLVPLHLNAVGAQRGLDDKAVVA